MYDYISKCGHLNSIIMSYNEFDKFKFGKCKTCGEIFTKEDREISPNIQARVLGVSKGNYNSRH